MLCDILYVCGVVTGDVMVRVLDCDQKVAVRLSVIPLSCNNSDKVVVLLAGSMI